MAAECNKTSEQAWLQEQQKIASALSREQVVPASLNASIRIVDGAEVFATNESSDALLCEQFEQVIKSRYGDNS